MGLEAACVCQVDGVTAEAKVLLEAAALIIRAPFRRNFELSGLTDVRVVADELRMQAGKTAIALHLGSGIAAKWAKKITTPPPDLAQKLGIGPASPALVIGAVEEPSLREALAGHMSDAAAARLSLAVVRDAAELDAALAAHEAANAGASIWIVHGKGPNAIFGEAMVRAHMRSLGYRDTKVAAVSATLTATRYAPASREG